jgi:circadian clock protein KaiB
METQRMDQGDASRASGTSATRQPAYLLRLYITGDAPNSVAALRNLRALCDRFLPGCHRIETVDLLENPTRGLVDGILVTPTLLKLEPPPRVMVVGTLSDPDRLLRELDLEPGEG